MAGDTATWRLEGTVSRAESLFCCQTDTIMRERMKVAASVGSFLLAVFVIGSCIHEIPAPLENTGTGTTGGTTGGGTTGGASLGCSADSVYFEQQVLPLVTSLCGKVGCHGTNQHHEFQLIYTSKSQSFSSISSRFSSSSRLAKALNEMAGQRVSGYTPPTSDQLAILQKWIAQGKKNNSCNGCDATQFAFAANVAPLFKFYCAGCHPAPGSQTTPNLSSLAAIQAELKNNPGRLLGSIQWTAPYNTSTTKMPQGSNQLSQCELDVIRKWVEAGAPNN